MLIANAAKQNAPCAVTRRELKKRRSSKCPVTQNWVCPDLGYQKSLQEYFKGDEVWLYIESRGGNVRCTVTLPRQDGNDWSYRLQEMGCVEELDDGRWVPQDERLKMAKRGPDNPKYKGPR